MENSYKLGELLTCIEKRIKQRVESRLVNNNRQDEIDFPGENRKEASFNDFEFLQIMPDKTSIIGAHVESVVENSSCLNYGSSVPSDFTSQNFENSGYGAMEDPISARSFGLNLSTLVGETVTSHLGARNDLQIRGSNVPFNSESTQSNFKTAVDSCDFLHKLECNSEEGVQQHVVLKLKDDADDSAVSGDPTQRVRKEQTFSGCAPKADPTCEGGWHFLADQTHVWRSRASASVDGPCSAVPPTSQAGRYEPPATSINGGITSILPAMTEDDIARCLVEAMAGVEDRVRRRVESRLRELAATSPPPPAAGSVKSNSSTGLARKAVNLNGLCKLEERLGPNSESGLAYETTMTPILGGEVAPAPASVPARHFRSPPREPVGLRPLSRSLTPILGPPPPPPPPRSPCVLHPPPAPPRATPPPPKDSPPARAWSLRPSSNNNYDRRDSESPPSPRRDGGVRTAEGSPSPAAGSPPAPSLPPHNKAASWRERVLRHRASPGAQLAGPHSPQKGASSPPTAAQLRRRLRAEQRLRVAAALELLLCDTNSRPARPRPMHPAENASSGQSRRNSDPSASAQADASPLRDRRPASSSSLCLTEAQSAMTVHAPSTGFPATEGGGGGGNGLQCLTPSINQSGADVGRAARACALPRILATRTRGPTGGASGAGVSPTTRADAEDAPASSRTHAESAPAFDDLDAVRSGPGAATARRLAVRRKELGQNVLYLEGALAKDITDRLWPPNPGQGQVCLSRFESDSDVKRPSEQPELYGRSVTDVAASLDLGSGWLESVVGTKLALPLASIADSSFADTDYRSFLEQSDVQPSSLNLSNHGYASKQRALEVAGERQRGAGGNEGLDAAESGCGHRDSVDTGDADGARRCGADSPHAAVAQLGGASGWREELKASIPPKGGAVTGTLKLVREQHRSVFIGQNALRVCVTVSDTEAYLPDVVGRFGNQQQSYLEDRTGPAVGSVSLAGQGLVAGYRSGSDSYTPYDSNHTTVDKQQERSRILDPASMSKELEPLQCPPSCSARVTERIRHVLKTNRTGSGGFQQAGSELESSDDCDTSICQVQSRARISSDEQWPILESESTKAAEQKLAAGLPGQPRRVIGKNPCDATQIPHPQTSSQSARQSGGGGGTRSVRLGISSSDSDSGSEIKGRKSSTAILAKSISVAGNSDPADGRECQFDGVGRDTTDDTAGKKGKESPLAGTEHNSGANGKYRPVVRQSSRKSAEIAVRAAVPRIRPGRPVGTPCLGNSDSDSSSSDSAKLRQTSSKLRSGKQVESLLETSGTSNSDSDSSSGVDSDDVQRRDRQQGAVVPLVRRVRRNRERKKTSPAAGFSTAQMEGPESILEQSSNRSSGNSKGLRAISHGLDMTRVQNRRLDSESDSDSNSEAVDTPSTRPQQRARSVVRVADQAIQVDSVSTNILEAAVTESVHEGPSTAATMLQNGELFGMVLPESQAPFEPAFGLLDRVADATFVEKPPASEENAAFCPEVPSPTQASLPKLHEASREYSVTTQEAATIGVISTFHNDSEEGFFPRPHLEPSIVCDPWQTCAMSVESEGMLDIPRSAVAACEALDWDDERGIYTALEGGKRPLATGDQEEQVQVLARKEDEKFISCMHELSQASKKATVEHTDEKGRLVPTNRMGDRDSVGQAQEKHANTELEFESDFRKHATESRLEGVGQASVAFSTANKENPMKLNDSAEASAEPLRVQELMHQTSINCHAAESNQVDGSAEAHMSVTADQVVAGMGNDHSSLEVTAAPQPWQVLLSENVDSCVHDNKDRLRNSDPAGSIEPLARTLASIEMTTSSQRQQQHVRDTIGERNEFQGFDANTALYSNQRRRVRFAIEPHAKGTERLVAEHYIGNEEVGEERSRTTCVLISHSKATHAAKPAYWKADDSSEISVEAHRPFSLRKRQLLLPPLAEEAEESRAASSGDNYCGTDEDDNERLLNFTADQEEPGTIVVRAADDAQSREQITIEGLLRSHGPHLAVAEAETAAVEGYSSPEAALKMGAEDSFPVAEDEQGTGWSSELQLMSPPPPPPPPRSPVTSVAPTPNSLSSELQSVARAVQLSAADLSPQIDGHQMLATSSPFTFGEQHLDLSRPSPSSLTAEALHTLVVDETDKLPNSASHLASVFSEGDVLRAATFDAVNTNSLASSYLDSTSVMPAWIDGPLPTAAVAEQLNVATFETRGGGESASAKANTEAFQIAVTAEFLTRVEEVSLVDFSDTTCATDVSDDPNRPYVKQACDLNDSNELSEGYEECSELLFGVQFVPQPSSSPQPPQISLGDDKTENGNKLHVGAVQEVHATVNMILKPESSIQEDSAGTVSLHKNQDAITRTKEVSFIVDDKNIVTMHPLLMMERSPEHQEPAAATVKSKSLDVSYPATADNVSERQHFSAEITVADDRLNTQTSDCQLQTPTKEIAVTSPSAAGAGQARDGWSPAAIALVEQAAAASAAASVAAALAAAAAASPEKEENHGPANSKDNAEGNLNATAEMPSPTTASAETTASVEENQKGSGTSKYNVIAVKEAVWGAERDKASQPLNLSAIMSQTIAAVTTPERSTSLAQVDSTNQHFCEPENESCSAACSAGAESVCSAAIIDSSATTVVMGYEEWIRRWAGTSLPQTLPHATVFTSQLQPSLQASLAPPFDAAEAATENTQCSLTPLSITDINDGLMAASDATLASRSTESTTIAFDGLPISASEIEQNNTSPTCNHMDDSELKVKIDVPFSSESDPRHAKQATTAEQAECSVRVELSEISAISQKSADAEPEPNTRAEISAQITVTEQCCKNGPAELTGTEYEHAFSNNQGVMAIGGAQEAMFAFLEAELKCLNNEFATTVDQPLHLSDSTAPVESSSSLDNCSPASCGNAHVASVSTGLNGEVGDSGEKALPFRQFSPSLPNHQPKLAVVESPPEPAQMCPSNLMQLAEYWGESPRAFANISRSNERRYFGGDPDRHRDDAARPIAGLPKATAGPLTQCSSSLRSQDDTEQPAPHQNAAEFKCVEIRSPNYNDTQVLTDKNSGINVGLCCNPEVVNAASDLAETTHSPRIRQLNNTLTRSSVGSSPIGSPEVLVTAATERLDGLRAHAVHWVGVAVQTVLPWILSPSQTASDGKEITKSRPGDVSAAVLEQTSPVCMLGQELPDEDEPSLAAALSVYCKLSELERGCDEWHSVIASPRTQTTLARDPVTFESSRRLYDSHPSQNVISNQKIESVCSNAPAELSEPKLPNKLFFLDESGPSTAAVCNFKDEGNLGKCEPEEPARKGANESSSLDRDCCLQKRDVQCKDCTPHKTSVHDASGTFNFTASGHLLSEQQGALHWPASMVTEPPVTPTATAAATADVFSGWLKQQEAATIDGLEAQCAGKDCGPERDLHQSSKVQLLSAVVFSYEDDRICGGWLDDIEKSKCKEGLKSYLAEDSAEVACAACEALQLADAAAVKSCDDGQDRCNVHLNERLNASTTEALNRAQPTAENKGFSQPITKTSQTHPLGSDLLMSSANPEVSQSTKEMKSAEEVQCLLLPQTGRDKHNIHFHSELTTSVCSCDSGGVAEGATALSQNLDAEVHYSELDGSGLSSIRSGWVNTPGPPINLLVSPSSSHNHKPAASCSSAARRLRQSSTKASDIETGFSANGTRTHSEADWEKPREATTTEACQDAQVNNVFNCTDTLVGKDCGSYNPDDRDLDFFELQFAAAIHDAREILLSVSSTL